MCLKQSPLTRATLAAVVYVYSCACIPKAYADMKNITSAILLENLCLTVSRICSHSSHTPSPLQLPTHTQPPLPLPHRHLAWLGGHSLPGKCAAGRAGSAAFINRQAGNWAKGRLKLCHTAFATAGGMRHVERCLSISSINTIYRIHMLNPRYFSKNSSDLFYFIFFKGCFLIQFCLHIIKRLLSKRERSSSPRIVWSFCQRQTPKSNLAAAAAGSCSASNCG